MGNIPADSTARPTDTPKGFAGQLCLRCENDESDRTTATGLSYLVTVRRSKTAGSKT